ncbi:MAG TPA: undecaprenyl-diphosphate phosphatase [Tenuifilaceae bacterium]|nr:undecaprenyl-diphosphate phosphatase [Tenuifilaceae bacterium]HPE18664.1 undecaprenyl-diphosphate phosphatase [Tenuifilaceae bacterium]HPJ45574.1 undecaprenyl-diphosphate phosphatase [Tenuifilaceae bacterium]HPQ33680.1 undecaprenyl-diphosphate phosphatase [Tenuifilaceae bacterium]
MSLIEAIILGIVQGLTEFLPVSSSGHLEIGKHLLGVETSDNLLFTVVVHGATVLSTLVVFRKDIVSLFLGLFRFAWNDETKYILAIAISMIPIAVVGFFFKENVEVIFNSPSIILIVGFMLLITALLLGFAYYRKSGEKKIGFIHAFIIGIAQTVAVLPGISRSGATIAAGLLLGVKKEEVARFSFLMVLIPILGENFLSLVDGLSSSTETSIGQPNFLVLAVGFIAAFVTGLMACKWMISIVKKGKLIWFAIYCAAVGLIAISSVILF